MKNNIVLCLSLLIILFINISIHAQTSSYKIANRFSVEGDGGWDCLISDDATNRLFVSHSTVMQIIDCANGKVLGIIKNMKGVHGIALANDFNKGFITSGRDSIVVIFNLTTYEEIARIKVDGKNPDIILYDGFSKKVFCFNGGSANATVIDAGTNEILSTISFDGKPEFAASDDAGKIFVNIEDKNQISCINTSSMAVEKSWSIAPGEEPSGLAIDIKNRNLFSVCGNKMMVVSNYETGKVVATVAIGEGPDGAAYDIGLKRAYSSNGDGTLTVVQEESASKYKVSDNFFTQKGARTVAINNITHHLYLLTAEFDPAPEKTAENPNPRPKIKPNSFIVLDIEAVK